MILTDAQRREALELLLESLNDPEAHIDPATDQIVFPDGRRMWLSADGVAKILAIGPETTKGA